VDGIVPEYQSAIVYSIERVDEGFREIFPRESSAYTGVTWVKDYRRYLICEASGSDQNAGRLGMEDLTTAVDISGLH
jgi:hypothetical protein